MPALTGELPGAADSSGSGVGAALECAVICGSSQFGHHSRSDFVITYLLRSMNSRDRCEVQPAVIPEQLAPPVDKECSSSSTAGRPFCYRRIGYIQLDWEA